MSKKPLQLEGVFTALITPFTADSSAVDFPSFEKLIDSQLAAGVRGLVACGSSGEACTLTDAEYREVVVAARRMSQGRVPLLSGISVSSTALAVEMGKFARDAECDGILVATPPYVKPAQTGIIEHFRAIRRASGLPLVAYNIPGRAGTSITPATLAILSREGTIAGVKECSGSLDTGAEILGVVAPECAVLTGDDSMTIGVMAYGGRGVISGPANALASETVNMVEAFLRADLLEARRLQMDLLPRQRILFIESNPVPVKAVLALRGTIAHPSVRLPLTPLQPANLERVREVFGL